MKSASLDVHELNKFIKMEDKYRNTQSLKLKKGVHHSNPFAVPEAVAQTNSKTRIFILSNKRHF